VREQAPGLPELDPNALGQLRTVGQIVDHLESHLGGASPQVSVPTAAVTALSKGSGGPPPQHRWALRAVPRAASALIGKGLLSAARTVITNDGAGVAGHLARALELRGIRAEVVDVVPADADAVICLAGLKDAADGDLSVAIEAFRAAKAVAANLTQNGGHFVTVQDTGGDFGLSGSPRAWLAGLTGLTKTAMQEWSGKGAHARAIDIERGAQTALEIAARLASEIVAGGPELEVGLRESGSRLVLESSPQAVSGKTQPIFGKGDVVIASGGARGVTAATLIELARATHCRLLLLGRTALVSEPAATAGAADEGALKRALLMDAKTRGVAVTPAEINKEVASILANREDARRPSMPCRQAGGEARYLAVDVHGSEEGVAMALEPCARSWGPVAARSCTARA
jgi:hypothetical protein